MIEISGKVIHGDGYGRVLGFPTANIDRRSYSRRKLKIRTGVWAGWVKVSSITYKAGITIGPLDKNRLPKIEAHLLGFKGSLYGKKITLSLQRFLRGWIYFKNEDALKKQIAKDIKKIKNIL